MSSFIYSMLSSATQFALEPVFAGINWGFSHVVPEREAKSVRENLETLESNLLLIYQPVSNAVQEKITPLLELFGIDKEKCIVLHHNTPNSPAGVSGSLNHWGKCILLLDSKFVKSLESKSELSKKDKFIIAHELAHILRDDFYAGSLHANTQAGKNRLLAYIISSIAFGIISPGGWIVSHLLGCCVAKVSGFLTDKKIRREFEFCADQLAAKKTDEIAQGAIELFTEQQQQNLEIITKYKRISEERNKKLNLRCSKWISDFPLLVSKLLISPEGNERIDFTHPPLSERKRKIEQLLSQ